MQAHAPEINDDGILNFNIYLRSTAAARSSGEEEEARQLESGLLSVRFPSFALNLIDSRI